jgi:hypothetical protein
MPSHSNSNGSDLESLCAQLRALPIEQCVKLLQSELDDTGLTVVLGGSNRTTSEVCINIYNSRDLVIDEILSVLGDWVRKKSED